MSRENRIGLGTSAGSRHEPATPITIEPGRRMRRFAAAHRGFTLVELLTVITIIAILATLLMTTLSSVKRKAREAVCISNLRQVGIGLHLYLEDYRERPPNLQTLASFKYIDARILACPADRAPQLSANIVSDGKSLAPGQASNASPSPHVSYQTPLTWTDEEWTKLMQAQTRAGVVACTFHDIAAPKRDPAAPLPTDGLILRGQLDGSVVHRQLYRPGNLEDAGAPPSPARNAATPAFAAAPDAPAPSDPPWDMFSDEPSP